METRIIQYKAKKEKADENETLIKEVFRQLKETCPKNLRYAAYKSEDGQTFIHLVSYEQEGGQSLADLPAFKNFQANIKDRFEVQPTFTTLRCVGSYEFENQVSFIQF